MDGFVFGDVVGDMSYYQIAGILITVQRRYSHHLRDHLQSEVCHCILARSLPGLDSSDP